jgi:hypothetical protein
VENPEELMEEFLKDMDPLLLKPEDFMQKWANFFWELLVEGATYEKMVKRKMRELKDCVSCPSFSTLGFLPWDTLASL